MHTHPALAAARIGTGCTRVLVTFYEPGEQVQQNSNNTRGDPGGRTTIAHTTSRARADTPAELVRSKDTCPDVSTCLCGLASISL
jgi:hypothetical protein